MAIPLLKQGVVSVLLMTPCYGGRRPNDQFLYFYRTVSEMLRASQHILAQPISLP
jgi:hypothetical protein